MTKVPIGLFSILMWVCCALFAESGCAAQDLPSSPRIAALQKLLEAGDRGALENFWQRVGQEGAPIIEIAPGEARHVLVTFLWRATSETKNVLLFSYALTFPDQVGISQGQLVRLRDTVLWYKTYVMRDDAGFTYAFSPNDSLVPFQPQRLANAKNDPLNPHHGAGLDMPQASLVELSEAPRQPWIKQRPGLPGGKIEERKLKSALLNNERTIRVYTPFGYRDSKRPYQLLVLFDGQYYTSTVPAPRILDNMISQGTIPPLVAVLIDNISEESRLRELHCNDTFAEFLARELIPWLRRTYRVTTDPPQLFVGGTSAGGLAAAFAGFRHPEIFGNVLSNSGSFSWKPGLLERYLNGGRPGPLNEGKYADFGWLMEQFSSHPRVPVRFYLYLAFL